MEKEPITKGIVCRHDLMREIMPKLVTKITITSI